MPVWAPTRVAAVVAQNLTGSEVGSRRGAAGKRAAADGVRVTEVMVRVLVEERQVQSRLEQLGLSLDGLLRVAEVGGGGYRATTAFHPTSAPGSYLYYETTAALRRLLVPAGWDADEADQQPRTFHAGRGIAIVVQTGDEMTGIDGGREPTTRHPKGVATQKKVAENGQQLALFPLGPQPNGARWQNWVFLVAIVDGQIRAELSLPQRWGEDSRPCGWTERILLPAQELGGSGAIELRELADVAELDRRDREAPGADFDVAWRQRTNGRAAAAAAVK